MSEKTPQQEFDEKYISSSEICKTLEVNRSSILYARKTGLLPEPIIIGEGHTCLWLRNEVQEKLNAWKLMLGIRRG